MLKKKALSRSRELTLPDERYRAVRATSDFLQRLAGGQIARVPKAVRQEAYALLRHYPNQYDLRSAARSAPDVFQERMEDLHRFIIQGSQQQQGSSN